MSFFESSNQRMALVMDITSSSIGAALVTSSNGISEVLFSSRMAYADESFRQAFRQTLSKIFKTGIPLLGSEKISRTIDHVLITLAPPFEKPRISVKRGSREQESQFDEKVAVDMIRDEAGELSQDDENLEVFQTELMALFLNGYEVPLASYPKVKSWEMDIFQARARKEFLEELEREISNVISSRRGFSVRSRVSIFEKLIPAPLKSSGSVFITSISGESIEALYLESGRVRDAGIIHFGPDHVSERVALEFNLPFAVAESYLSLHAEEVLLPEITYKIDKIALEEEEKWREAWSKTLAPKSVDRIFFITDRDDAVTQAFFRKLFPKSHIVSASEERIFSHSLKPGKFNSTDESLSMLALYSNSLI